MDETIQPMGIDMVLAALALRFRSWGPEELQGKTIDLRKACKNLPYLRVLQRLLHLCHGPGLVRTSSISEPGTSFGARAAVMGLCLVSFALWLIGVVIFKLHWTVSFDDFYLVASKAETKHVDMTQQLFFQLVGWEVSSEKEAEFNSLARILEVQIDLNESLLGVFHRLQC